jgi:nicotinamide-nucleotide amidase
MICKAHLLTIGDEILIGQVLDTNSSYLSSVLTGIGVSVQGKSTIGDHAESILQELQQLWKTNDLLVITGGLGPTNDDITKKVLLEFFEDHLVHHPPTLERIREMFRAYGREINDAQYGQAMLPSACEPLANALGTAPGMWFMRDNKVLISLPGVPYEMIGIMEGVGLDRIRAQFTLPKIYHKTLLTMGIGESYIAEKIKDIEEGLPGTIRLAYLPHTAGVRLRLSCTGEENETVRAVEEVMQAMVERLDKWVYGFNEDSLPAVLLSRLQAQGLSLATAESCTGGNLAHVLTQVPGASHTFKGSVVAYHSQTKISLLDVPRHIIDTYGVVSRETAEAMAEGIAHKLGADMGISTTGIAGPGGGSKDLPVGTVWVSVWLKGRVHSELFRLGEQRTRIIERATMWGLLEAYRLVKNDIL